MVSSCAHGCGGLVQERHSSGAYDHEEFFWLDGICCPKCSLDVPYLPSMPRNLLVGLLRRASQVKRVVKKRKIRVQCWLVLLPLLQDLSLLPCKKSAGAFPD